MKAEDFDNAFENGDNLSSVLDVKRAVRIHFEQRRINLDVPEWMLTKLDHEAARVGITRQSVIKMWLAERIEQVGTVKP